MKTTTLSPAYEKLPDSMTPANIVAITTRRQGQKRSLIPETNTPMLTRKRASLITPTQQKTTEGTSSIQNQRHSHSSLYATTSPSLPSPSNSLDPPPSPSFTPSTSATRTQTIVLQNTPTQSTNSTGNTQGPSNHNLTLGQKRRKSVPTPTTTMVTRKRASISRPSNAPHKTNTSLNCSHPKSSPSPSLLVPTSSPSPTLQPQFVAHNTTHPQTIHTPMDLTPDDLAVELQAPIITYKAVDNFESSSRIDHSVLQKALSDSNSIVEQQSAFDKTPESVDDGDGDDENNNEEEDQEDDEMLLASKDIHPELFMMMQDIKKKKEDRIKLAIARRDAQLKSHQAYFDSIVHKANMEFITKHNELRNYLHANISRQRLQLCSEHATSTDDFVCRGNGRGPLMELPPLPHGLSHHDSNEDIGLIHTSIALDYASTLWMGPQDQ